MHFALGHLMSLHDAIRKDVDNVLSARWSIRSGVVVPSTTKVLLGGGGVRLRATMLYADLADSTELAMQYDRRVAAKVFKAFVACSSRLIKSRGGEVRSYDGDRVMGVFLGSDQDAASVQCALNINYVFVELIVPKLLAKYPSLRAGPYQLAHSVGVDTSEVLVVRGGVHRSNDLIWVGRAPNVAAKLSSIREHPYQTFITADVYRGLPETHRRGPKGQNIWQQRRWSEVKGLDTLYRSKWNWEI